MDADLLTLIFTGPGKDDLSGPELAALSPAEVRARLEKLSALRLLEATRREARSRQERQTTAVAQPAVFSGVGDVTYSVHPAVRDGFLLGLDADRARLGHDAARAGLVASLGGLPGRNANPGDPRTLDLLEEIIYHALEAGRGDAAWEMYRWQMGGYENLGRRLGAYERGERISRAFAGAKPAEAAPLPGRLQGGSRAVFLNRVGAASVRPRPAGRRRPLLRAQRCAAVAGRELEERVDR